MPTRSSVVVMTFGSLMACSGPSQPTTAPTTAPTTVEPEPVKAKVDQRDKLAFHKGICRLVPPPMDCPPDMMCNPPPVTQIECPSAKVRRIERASTESACMAERTWVDCHENWNCDEPTTVEVPCPETFAGIEGAVVLRLSAYGCDQNHGTTSKVLLCPEPMVNEVAPGYVVSKLKDGTCEAELEDIDCEPNEICNPPPPFPVVCPPDEAPSETPAPPTEPATPE